MATNSEWRSIDGSMTRVSTDGAILRRPRRAFSPAVHSFLKWLEHRQFPFAPKAVGLEQDQELLTFARGAAIKRPWPAEVLDQAFVHEMGVIFRQLHEASAGFALPDGEAFSFGSRLPSEGHVVCHGDPGPWNVIVRDGHVSTIIDWDFAHFGDPLEDLIWLALDFAPLRDVEISDADLPADFASSRLKSLCDGYGDANPEMIVSAAPSFLVAHAALIRAQAAAGNALFAQLLSRNIPDELEKDAAYIERRFGRHWSAGACDCLYELEGTPGL